MLVPTPSEGTFKILELFSGTGSLSKIARTLKDVRTISVDINEETAGHKADVVADILKIDFKKWTFGFDAIFAGPPCQTYSIMSGAKHRTKDDMEPKTKEAKEGRAILKKTLEVIAYFHSKNPELVFYIENPYGGRMKFETELFNLLPPHGQCVVSYCKYGFKYQKDTMFWTNDWNFLRNALRCTKDTPCEYVAATGKHPEGVRAHPENGQTAGPQSLAERYAYPPGLVKSMLVSLFTDTEVCTVGSALHDLMPEKVIDPQVKIAELTEELQLAAELIDMHEHSGDDVAADDVAPAGRGDDADVDAADDASSVSSVASSGTNWLERFPDVVVTPWDSDEDTEQYKLFSGRGHGALVTFPEPELEPELEPVSEPEPESQLEFYPPDLNRRRLKMLQKSSSIPPFSEPEPEPELPVVMGYDAEGSPDW